MAEALEEMAGRSDLGSMSDKRRENPAVSWGGPLTMY